MLSDSSNHGNKPSETIEALFETLETPLLAYAYRLARSVEVAQDLVQEAFMKLQVHFKQVREPKPWLYRTVHNLAANHHRKSGRHISMQQTTSTGETLLIESEDEGMLPDESIVHQEAVGLVRISLESLDERSRRLIRLKFEEEMSYREIAEVTGLSVSNVGYVLHHAIKSLGVELKKIGVGK